ncbi:hypothetical protein KSS87_005004 [Heliosperma pusillum]|nr:hypothetical protein KSS87_005004 [Heliosperma pusillum]
MLRNAATKLRRFSTVVETPAVDDTFVNSWKKLIPNLDPPNTPSSYMKPRPPIPSTIPSKLTVNLALPYSSLLSSKETEVKRQQLNVSGLIGFSQVDMVIVPATTGQMGVLPGHVATIAELKPGIMSVHEGTDVSKYFISSGFAVIHSNSYADIVAVEAVPIDRIDPAAVQKGLAEFTQKLGSASTDLEKAEAQIGIDVHSALNAAITA